MKRFFVSSIVEIYKQVFSLLKKNPTILFLFFVVALLDGLALTALFYAPSPPFSYVLAPIIRAFWSDDFLHYPSNFLLLPKLFGHAHFLISTLIGVFVTGLVIKKIEADTKGEQLSTIFASGIILKKYIPLVIAWLISYVAFTVILKGFLYILPNQVLLQIAGSFMVSLLVQALFTFLLPSIVLLDKNFFLAVAGSLKMGFRNILMMSSIFIIPMVLALALAFTKLYTPIFVQTYPEAVLWVLAIGIVITLFVDIFITTSSTLIFLRERK